MMLNEQLIIETLKLSCIEDMECDESNASMGNPYLERREDVEVEVRGLSNEEVTSKIKEYFAKLVSQGIAPTEAAAKAINQVSKEKQETTTLPSGAIVGKVESLKISGNRDEKINIPSKLEISREVLLTANKYLENVLKNPSIARFRNFKVSNKVFDRITCTPRGLNFLRNELGFQLYKNEVDFMASIPLGLDLDSVRKRIDDLLVEQS